MSGWASLLVGRRDELLAFERTLADVEREEARALGLRGEPGIGKSRLLAPLGDEEAVSEVDEAQLRELAAVLPPTGPLAEVEPALVSGERHRVARSVRALLERVAADRPVALLLDDVHWADPASVDVLALLLHRPPRGRVLMALAARAGRARELESGLAAAR